MEGRDRGVLCVRIRMFTEGTEETTTMLMMMYNLLLNALLKTYFFMTTEDFLLHLFGTLSGAELADSVTYVDQ